MTFTVVIEPRALADIQTAIDYYEEQQTGLCKKFNSVLDKHIGTLKTNPFFQIVYKDYRVLTVKNFLSLFFSLLMKLNLRFISFLYSIPIKIQ